MMKFFFPLIQSIFVTILYLATLFKFALKIHFIPLKKKQGLNPPIPLAISILKKKTTIMNLLSSDTYYGSCVLCAEETLILPDNESFYIACWNCKKLACPQCWKKGEILHKNLLEKIPLRQQVFKNPIPFPRVSNMICDSCSLEIFKSPTKRRKESNDEKEWKPNNKRRKLRSSKKTFSVHRK